MHCRPLTRRWWQRGPMARLRRLRRHPISRSRDRKASLRIPTFDWVGLAVGVLHCQTTKVTADALPPCAAGPESSQRASSRTGVRAPMVAEKGIEWESSGSVVSRPSRPDGPGAGAVPGGALLDGVHPAIHVQYLAGSHGQQLAEESDARSSDHVGVVHVPAEWRPFGPGVLKG